jgi:serine protease Do
MAAGIGAGLAVGYMHFDASAVGTAEAATQHVAVAAATPATAAANLPDFTALVDRAGSSVVNISTFHAAGKGQVDMDDIDEDSPYYEFFKRFGGMPNGQGMRPQQPTRGLGSGFIVSPDGYIVTNAHVVDGASEVVVKLTDRREFTAKVVGADKRTDIALVKIDAKNLPALDLAAEARGEARRMGDRDRLAVRLREQRVGRRRERRASRAAGRANGAVHPDRRRRQSGNSGGPLLNARGQVVGVNSQIYSRSGGYMGLSFAIPVDVAAKVADQLRTSGKVAHGRLGIGVQALDQSLAQSFGLPDSNGALVGQVEKDSPAAKAGFKSGDVIRKINGVAVADSTDVTSRIGNTAPGTTVDIEVWRAGKAVELSAKVGALDDGKVAKVSDEAEQKGKLGVAVRPRSAEEQSAGAKGGLVVEQAGGAAAKAGVQRGDVILGVGSSAVNSVDELRSAVDKSGKTVALLIERQGRQIYVPVKLS